MRLPRNFSEEIVARKFSDEKEIELQEIICCPALGSCLDVYLVSSQARPGRVKGEAFKLF